ncbi:MAG: transcriptional regulator GutM [Sporolactobacillus sp.]
MFFIILMIFIGGAFILQNLFGYFQIRHFTATFVKMRRRGRIAIGKRKGNFRSGTLVFLVIDEKGTIIEAQKMQGVTVFAHFHSLPDLIGDSIQSLAPEKLLNYNKLLRFAVQNAADNYTMFAQGKAIPDNVHTPVVDLSLYLRALLHKLKIGITK